MRNKLLLSFCALALFVTATVWADEAQDRWKTSNQQTEKNAVPLPPIQVEGKAGDATPSATQLEPGLAKIEAQFSEQIQAIMHDLASAQTADELATLQQQAMDLKIQWSLALAYRQLELAREHKDAATEAQILQIIDNLQHPSAVEVPPPPRPEGDKAVQGGAR